MTKNSEEEKTRWDQVMENFDLLFEQINNMGVIQQEMKKAIIDTQAEQKVMSKQVQANGQAVAQLTIRQMDMENQSNHSADGSVIFEDDDFQNIFSKDKKVEGHGSGHRHKHHREHPGKDELPHHTLPKLLFPKFGGTTPKIWFDDCVNYFTIYSVPEHLKVTAATMHLEGNARKWWQAYRQNHAVTEWSKFCEVV